MDIFWTTNPHNANAYNAMARLPTSIIFKFSWMKSSYKQCCIIIIVIILAMPIYPTPEARDESGKRKRTDQRNDYSQVMFQHLFFK